MWVAGWLEGMTTLLCFHPWPPSVTCSPKTNPCIKIEIHAAQTDNCSNFCCSPLTDSYPFVLYLVDLFSLCLIPLWVVVASKHPSSQGLLQTGWEPIITAMIISRYAPHSCS